MSNSVKQISSCTFHSPTGELINAISGTEPVLYIDAVKKYGKYNHVIYCHKIEYDVLLREFTLYFHGEIQKYQVVAPFTFTPINEKK